MTKFVLFPQRLSVFWLPYLQLVLFKYRCWPGPLMIKHSLSKSTDINEDFVKSADNSDKARQAVISYVLSMWEMSFRGSFLYWAMNCIDEGWKSQWQNFLFFSFVFVFVFVFVSQNLGSGDPDELSLISNPSNRCTWLHQKWPRSIIKSPYCIWFTFVFVFRFQIVFVGAHPCLAFASKYVLCIEIKRTWISMLMYVFVPLLKHELDSLHYQEL